jgi:ribosomal protein L37AE/L43A
MDTISAMSSALNTGADDGRKTANGTEKGEPMKPNCKDCYYRQLMARMGESVWWTDCDKCGSELCGKMNDPEFVRHLKEEGKL